MMNPEHASNCDQLRNRFDGREAIYVEKGVLRVRVSNIRGRGAFHIRADVEEIATPGLGVGLFHRPRLSGAGPLRWRIGAGYLTTFSAQSWKMGYGGWSLYFAPDIVQAVVGCAVGLVAAPGPYECFLAVGRVLRGLETNEPDELVFPDAVGPGGEF